MIGLFLCISWDHEKVSDCMCSLTPWHWNARECHCSNKDSTNQVASKCKPSVWIETEDPTLGVFVHCIVVVVHSGLLPSANSDSAQPVKAVRNVRVDRAACWNKWKTITHMHIHSEVILYKRNNYNASHLWCSKWKQLCIHVLYV